MSDSKANRQIVLWIMAGLTVWIGFLAVGYYLQYRNLRGALIMVAGMGLFLAAWLTALAVRRSRNRANKKINSD